MRIKKLVLFFLIASMLWSCSSKRSIVGTYRSRFATLGFFVTTLKLKSDSSFDYTFVGDLISRKATGSYVMYKRKLILAYNLTPLDTGTLKSYKELGLHVSDSLKNETGYPHVFYWGNNKLFDSWQDGKIVRRTKTYHKQKEFLLFGSHYYKKKYFLKRVN
jgi:hypothetical protein